MMTEEAVRDQIRDLWKQFDEAHNQRKAAVWESRWEDIPQYQAVMDNTATRAITLDMMLRGDFARDIEQAVKEMQQEEAP